MFSKRKGKATTDDLRNRQLMDATLHSSTAAFLVNCGYDILDKKGFLCRPGTFRLGMMVHLVVDFTAPLRNLSNTKVIFPVLLLRTVALGPAQ